MIIELRRARQHVLEAREPRGEEPVVSSRLTAFVAACAVAALGALAAAAVQLAAAPPAASALAGMGVLLAVAALAEAYPVPVPGVSADGVSLAAVALIGCAVLYRWEAAALLGAVAPALVDALRRRPVVRSAFNASAYALATAAAGATAAAAGAGPGSARLAVAVGCAAAAFYGVNVFLLAGVVALAERESYPSVLRRSVGGSAPTFAIMASVALMLVVLWQRSPFLLVALAGPLIAVVLYQRSAHREIEALRLAHTDPLTGLGNYRRFQERLAVACDEARLSGAPFALCMVDLDDLKALNDRYGHPAGDRVLREVAQHLRREGEAFRLGGDEFALLLPDPVEGEGVMVARMVVERVVSAAYPHSGEPSVSVGVASFPVHGWTAAELVEAADAALYRAKAEGRGHVCSYGGDLVGPASRSATGRGRSRRPSTAAHVSGSLDARAG
jgi:diguanylate cyclase (GGDEF)-like protein